MNCNYVKDLLPLYVGRDLDEKRSSVIAKHLQSCDACAGSAEEYRETLEMMQLFEPPQFSEGVYAGVRQRVLREIEQQPVARTLPQIVAGIFQPRIRWAVATALFLAVSLSVFYFVTNRNDDRPRIAEAGSGTNPNAKSNESIARSNDELPETTPPPRSTEGPVIRTQTSRQRRGLNATDRVTSVAVKQTLDPDSATVKVSPESNTVADPDTVATRVPAAQEKTLRMEMQTKDPNIRIIWFSTQRTKHDSPNKSTKRHQEVRTNA